MRDSLYTPPVPLSKLVEVEYGFRVTGGNIDLDGKHTAQLMQLEFVPTIEVLSGRYEHITQVSLWELLADGNASDTVVIGEGYAALPAMRHIPGPIVTIDDQIPFQASEMPSDRLELIVSLAQQLRRRGLELLSGQIIITGSIIASVPAERFVDANWKSFGHVRVGF